MNDNPAVLLLMSDVHEREHLSSRLVELKVTPICVHADRAAAAVERHQPIAVFLDDGHAATAPEDFLEATCTHHVRLFTLPDRRLHPAVADAVLQDALTPRPF